MTEITGQTFNDLRNMRNAVTHRIIAISQAVNPLFELSVTMTADMQQAWAEHRAVICEREYAEDENVAPYGIQLMHADFFTALLPYPYGSNIAYTMNNIRVLAAKYHYESVPPGNPTFSGFTAEELDFVCGRYQSQITSTVTALRDIHTNWKGLDRARDRLPSFIKSVVMGLFGKPDTDHGFSYTEDDFKYGCRAQVMTARWLTPFIGYGYAKMIEDAMATIERESKPRIGEPPTLEFFGNLSKNAIKLF